MNTTATMLQFHQRLWFAWVVPVVAYWVFLYIATRNANPMAFPIIFSAAILVPVVNAWVLIPKFRTKVAAVLVGFVVPVVAVIVLVLF